MNLYPFIEAEQAECRNVKRSCELLEVSRSAFYEYRKTIPSLRQVRDGELTALINKIHADSKGTYGHIVTHKSGEFLLRQIAPDQRVGDSRHSRTAMTLARRVVCAARSHPSEPTGLGCKGTCST